MNTRPRGPRPSVPRAIAAGLGRELWRELTAKWHAEVDLVAAELRLDFSD